MKQPLILMATFAGVAIVATACGSSSGYGNTAGPPPAAAAAGAPATPPTTVAVGTTGLGQVLVDGKARTLYLFEGDTNGVSSCTNSGCTAEWPPLLTTAPPLASGGLTPSALGTTTRADGSRQVTYDGHPLYRFAGDTRPGAHAGQGLNDNGGLWYVVRADGSAVVG